MGNADLPVCNASKIAATLVKCFAWSRAASKRGKGSHLVLTKPGHRPIVLPTHGDVKRALLAGVLRDAEISIEDFCAKHK